MGPLLLFLLFINHGQSAIFINTENTAERNPKDIKVTKLFDVKEESKGDNWKNNLNNLIQYQNEENEIDIKDEFASIPVKLTVAVKKIKSETDFDKNLPLFNIFEACKPLVGVSKMGICSNINAGNSEIKKPYPRNCREILENGNNKSGIYEIQPRTSSKPFNVLCDMETSGGGWTHIQKRYDGSEDFYRNWRDYKFGFGDLNKEFWIGLENIHHMSAFETSELLIELTDREKKTAYAKYTAFAIGAEKEGYNLSVLKGFSGTAGDAFTPHLGSKFSTFDVDQDESGASCAQTFVGAWWYKNCHTSNLNGKYMNLVLAKVYEKHGLNWNGFRGHEYNLAGSRMLIRPIGE